MNRTRQAHKPTNAATLGFLLPIHVDKVFICIGFLPYVLISNMRLVVTTAGFNSIVLNGIIVFF